jgi:hypothetical protein
MIMNSKFKSAVLAFAMIAGSVWVAKVATTPERIVTNRDLHHYQQTQMASFTVRPPIWSGWGMLVSGGLLLSGGGQIVKALEKEDSESENTPAKATRQPKKELSEDESDSSGDLVEDESLEETEEGSRTDFTPRLPEADHPLYKESKVLIDLLEQMNLHSDFVEAIAGPSIIEITVQPQMIPKLGRRVTVSNIERASSDLQVKIPTKRPPVIKASEKGLQIQIPRNDRQIIDFESINPSWELRENPVDIELLLGCDINFKPVRAKFRDLPHWFILGESGGGKSVLLQCQVADLMKNYSPKAIQFVLSDLKGETFYQIPDKLPWLAQPVSVDPESSINQIEWLIKESERRQKTFEDVGVPSWEGYNELMIEQGQPVMPRLIYISDENSDLSEKGGKWTSKWESLMPEFTRKCRSRGINVIVTQQRGTADQISRAVVSNLQGRICLSVVDEPNSTVCIGSSGGENLLGKGDLLAKTKFELIRLQSPYLNPKLQWFLNIPEEYKSSQKVEPSVQVVSKEVEELEFTIPQSKILDHALAKSDWNHVIMESSDEDIKELMKVLQQKIGSVDSTVENKVEPVESTSTPLQVITVESTPVDSASTLPSTLSYNSVDESTFEVLYKEKFPNMTGKEIEVMFWGNIRNAIIKGELTSDIIREVLFCTGSRDNSTRHYRKIGVPLLTYFLQNYGLKDPEIADKVRTNFRNVK